MYQLQSLFCKFAWEEAVQEIKACHCRTEHTEPNFLLHLFLRQVLLCYIMLYFFLSNVLLK